MSSRNFRRVAGKNDLPPPPDDSDEDYEPLYAQRSGNSTYAGLVLSSNSESERGSDRSEEESHDKVVTPTTPSGSSIKKKNLKKKGKGKARKQADELDEIDRFVQEVNDILGAPAPAPGAELKKNNPAAALLMVDPKHLNVANELRRLFGPDSENNRRTRHPANRALLLKRVLVHPNKDTTVFEFKNSGLSMSKDKEINNHIYFVFDHSESYQKMHRAFLTKLSTLSASNLMMTLEVARQNMHVEALLEISDRLFRFEEAGMANEIIENVVTFLQYVAHPLFILSQNTIRLEYKYMENRPFHVAMLKYIYLLTNKACHRTALEIAKMMVSLDRSDPLAIVSVIDVLALRAREHEWLIDTISYFDRERDACRLYNINYSNALAHFHVAQKNKQDLAKSNALIREAILVHPEVLLKIMEFCKVSNSAITDHAIFARDPKMPGSGVFDELFMIYAKMTAPRWNEPNVMNWLMKNATELCEAYNNDPIVKEDAKRWTTSRNALFEVWPPEILRHVSVLSSMAKLVLDTPLTTFNRPTCAWDPLFDKSINRYKYSYKTPRPQNVGEGRSPIYSNNIRNAHLILLAQLAMHTGCFPQFINFASTEPPGSNRRPQPNGTGPNVPSSDAATDFNNSPGNTATPGANESPGPHQFRGNSNIGLTFTLPESRSSSLMPSHGETTQQRVVIRIPDNGFNNIQVDPAGPTPAGENSPPWRPRPDPGPWRQAPPTDDDEEHDEEQNIEYDDDYDEEDYERCMREFDELLAAAPSDETLGGIFKQADVD